MPTYRVTYVNIATSPKASTHIVRARDRADAIEVFRREVNQTVVVRSAGANGICQVERLAAGERWVGIPENIGG